jgi:hypothetical protein
VIKTTFHFIFFIFFLFFAFLFFCRVINYFVGETFKFGLSLMEERLLAGGGVTEMFKKYQNQLFRVAMGTQAGGCGSENSGCKTDAQLAW